MEDMAMDFGWSMDDFWEQVPLTPEEEEADRRSLEQAARDDMIGEMYAARYSFDWVDKSRETWSAPCG